MKKLGRVKDLERLRWLFHYEPLPREVEDVRETFCAMVRWIMRQPIAADRGAYGELVDALNHLYLAMEDAICMRVRVVTARRTRLRALDAFYAQGYTGPRVA